MGLSIAKVLTERLGGCIKAEYAEGKLTINSTGQYFEGSFSHGDPYTGTWYDGDGKEIKKLKKGK